MYLLALETTGAHASAAIINEEGQTREKHSDGVLNHLQTLMPMVEGLLQENGLSLGDITAVAASQGPGSFTGIRIGVASARALAQALGIKTIPVPTLKAFVYNIENDRSLICPVFDARRDQVYAGAYQWRRGEIAEVVKGAPYTIAEFLEKVGREENALFFGDGIQAYESWFARKTIAPEPARFQKASSVARLALRLYEAGQVVGYEDLKPDYMRKAEAERKLEGGNG